MIPPPDRRKPSARRRSGRARLRVAVAWFALASLVLPSLGALPWICADAAFDEESGHEHHQTLARGGDDAVDEHAGHHHDASDIPGSPLHPADHDCSPCQVLATLARCAILPPAVPVVAVVPPPPLRASPVVAPRVTVVAVVLPPVRAPPFVHA